MSRTKEQWLIDLRADDVIVCDTATKDLQDRLRYCIVRQFLGKGLDGSCIDDVVQETSLRILGRLDSFRGDSSFLTWATAIAIRTGMEMLRRGVWSHIPSTELSVSNDQVDLANQWECQAPSAETLAQQEEVLQLLTREMNESLSTRQRCALLQLLRGSSVANITHELGTTRGAVYKLTHDARKRLKTVLEEAGFDGNEISSLFSE